MPQLLLKQHWHEVLTVPSLMHTPLLLQYALKLEKRKDRNTVRAEYKASILLQQTLRASSSRQLGKCH
jgi:hypothetical protein